MLKKDFFLAGITVVTLCVSSCKHDKHEADHAVEMPVSTPMVTDTVVTKNYVSQIRSINHIELRAQEKGYLQNIYVDEGQFVKKGQVLFKIMPNLYEAEVEKAKAEAKVAEIELQNTQALVEEKVVAANELAMAKAKYQKAKADLDLMQTHLNFTVIRAPFDGIIDRFHVRLGSFIEEGELLTELSDNSKMWVYFNVPESEYLSYMKSTDARLKYVKLKLADGEWFDQDGIVETIEADFDHETGNIPFRATFPNPKRLLRYGQTGTIVITSALKNAILIPQKAVFEILDKRFVFVVDDKNVVHATEIEVEAEMAHLYAIKSGIESTDRILIDGIRKVKDNQTIKVKAVPAASVYSNLELYAE